MMYKNFALICKNLKRITFFTFISLQMSLNLNRVGYIFLILLLNEGWSIGSQNNLIHGIHIQ